MKRRAPATADEILSFIAGYLEARDGVSPSYQDICDALDITSKSGVDRRLAEIEASGRLFRMKGHHRAMAITVPVAIPRAPDGAPLYFVRMP